MQGLGPNSQCVVCPKCRLDDGGRHGTNHALHRHAVTTRMMFGLPPVTRNPLSPKQGVWGSRSRGQYERGRLDISVGRGIGGVHRGRHEIRHRDAATSRRQRQSGQGRSREEGDTTEQIGQTQERQAKQRRGREQKRRAGGGCQCDDSEWRRSELCRAA